MSDNAKNITASEIKFVDGSKDTVIGKVRLFNTNERENLLNPNDNYFNVNNVLSVKPIDIEVCIKCGSTIDENEIYSDGELYLKEKYCPKCNRTQSISPL